MGLQALVRLSVTAVSSSFLQDSCVDPRSSL
jgi:hypothetical protein